MFTQVILVSLVALVASAPASYDYSDKHSDIHSSNSHSDVGSYGIHGDDIYTDSDHGSIHNVHDAHISHPHQDTSYGAHDSHHDLSYNEPHGQTYSAPHSPEHYEAPHTQHNSHSAHGTHGSYAPVSQGNSYGHDDSYEGPAQYEFSYGVQDDYNGANFGHSEKRDGDRTEGVYYVDLPDGRRQKVEYYVDKWGYHPTVTYEGEAQYPSHGAGAQYGSHSSGAQYSAPPKQYSAHDIHHSDQY